jgi:hypothetical protein
LIGMEGARLLENEDHIFFVRCNAVEAFLVLRESMSQSDEWAHRTPRGKGAPEMEINYFQHQ